MTKEEAWLVWIRATKTSSLPVETDFGPCFQGLNDLSALVDDTGDSCICGTAKCSPGFHSPQPGIGHMLMVAGGITPPAVVGQHKQEVGACPDEGAHMFTIY